MNFLFRQDFRSLIYLNLSQFLGALNDNIFKLLLVYLLIALQGEDQASKILSLTGAVFVLPFLLFSSVGGVLADKFSKRTILVVMKAFELIIMLLSLLAIYLQSAAGLYILLFLLATQAAIFGPSKYGIIPEIVEAKKVSKANGLLSSFTYLAIIFGTFLASFLTDLSNKNFLLASSFCVIVAIVGFWTSLKIQKTPPTGSEKKLSFFFFYEIYQTLSLCHKRPHLLPSILGSAFFLFLGGFVQLNTIPFAMQSLHLTDVGGGYLFLSTAIGIAIGSVLAGKLSKDQIQPSFSCLAGFAMSIFLFCLWAFSSHLILVILTFIALGLFGGIFLIPLDSFIQIASPDNKRGQVIAASNFLSFFGVLIASFLLYLTNDFLGFQAKTSFCVLGGLTFLFSVFLTGRMSDLLFPYLMQKWFSSFYSLTLSEMPSSSTLLVLQKGSWKDAFVLFSVIPKLKVLTVGKKGKDFPYNNAFLNAFKIVAKRKNTPKNLLKKAILMKKGQFAICLFIKNPFSPQEWKETFSKIKEAPFTEIKYVSIQKSYSKKRFLGISMKKSHTMVSFLPVKIR